MRGVTLFFAIALGSPGVANACLDARFEKHVFFAERPGARLADGLQMLKVQVIDPERTEAGNSGWTMVTVLEEQLGFQVGERLRVEVDLRSSCARWGYLRGPAYIVGYARRSANKPVVFDARSFRLDQIRRNPVPQ